MEDRSPSSYNRMRPPTACPKHTPGLFLRYIGSTSRAQFD